MAWSGADMRCSKCNKYLPDRCTCQPVTWRVGGKYNWIGQPERLVYLGKNWSGNGYWHQFEKVGESGKVWCEVLDSDLLMFEETKPLPGSGTNLA